MYVCVYIMQFAHDRKNLQMDKVAINFMGESVVP